MKELINIFYMPFSTATRSEVIMVASFLLAVFLLYASAIHGMSYLLYQQ